MPHTLSGYSQLFFLQTVAPDGAPINLQFFAKPSQAQLERADVEKALHVSNATSVGYAFVRVVGPKPLAKTDIKALRQILPH